VRAGELHVVTVSCLPGEAAAQSALLSTASRPRIWTSTRAQAIFIGQARQQHAVLDLLTGECIDTWHATVITSAGLLHTGIATWAA
jgi:hypothetical protein